MIWELLSTWQRVLETARRWQTCTIENETDLPSNLWLMDLKGISSVFSLQEMMKIFAYVLVFMCLLRLLVHSWCILGAFLVHSWCILGAFRCPRARRGGLHQLFSTASALPRSSKDSFNIWKCIHAWTWSLAQSKLPLEICSTSAWFSCRLGCNGEQFEHGHCWTPNPQFRNMSKPCIAQPIASCPKALELDHFTFRSVWFCDVLWHQSGSGWYSQGWPGWHIGHSAQTSSLAFLGTGSEMLVALLSMRKAPTMWRIVILDDRDISWYILIYLDYLFVVCHCMSECRLLNQLPTGTRLFYPWPILNNHNYQ